MKSKNYALPFRVGRKQGKVVLDANGLEVCNFPTEEMAQQYSDMMNEHESRSKPYILYSHSPKRVVDNYHRNVADFYREQDAREYVDWCNNSRVKSPNITLRALWFLTGFSIGYFICEFYISL